MNDIKSKSLDELFVYSDDLLTIHRQLTKACVDAGKKVGAPVLIADTKMRAMYDQTLLETVSPEGMDDAQYAFAHEVYKDAHIYAINAFYDCWGVLPSSELDDYRNLSSQPMALSTAFIEEALAARGKDCVDLAECLTTGYMTYEPAREVVSVEPIFVASIKDSATEFPSRVILDDNDALTLKEPSAREFVVDGKVYAYANDLNIVGPGWAEYIQWLTDADMEAKHASVR
jgi:hypothetical protein